MAEFDAAYAGERPGRAECDQGREFPLRPDRTGDRADTRPATKADVRIRPMEGQHVRPEHVRIGRRVIDICGAGPPRFYVQETISAVWDGRCSALRDLSMVRLGGRQFRKPVAAGRAVHLHRISWRKIDVEQSFERGRVGNGRKA